MVMASSWSFALAAAVLVALVLAVLLPWVWRQQRARDPSPAGRRRAWALSLVLGIGLPAAGALFYALRGDPAALNADRSALSQALLQGGLPAAGEAAQGLQAELAQHLARQPDDPRALVLKARLDMRAERFGDAAAAYGRALQGRSKAVNDAGIWAEYAEAKALAQGGQLAGEPVRLLQRALSIDARHPLALDLAGSAAWEVRDFAKAAMYWKRLLELIPAGEPRHAELRTAIQRAEQRARFALPTDSAP
jgi:cytochrome c-type biogenesis protein CcmH